MLASALTVCATEIHHSLASVQFTAVTSQGSGTSTSPWVPLATLGAASIAALVAFVAAVFQRRSAREAAAASREAAAAAKMSAESSQRSAGASEAAVRLSAKTSEAAGLRADSEARSKRYQDAAGQLGNDKAAVRLAGVYAMARLADDWPERRQMCVDVLCAYLRMPLTAENAAPDGQEEQVRDTFVAVLRAHLQDPDAETSWSRLKLNLSGARFYRLNLDGAVFIEPPDFRFLTVEWECSFRDSIFRNGGDLSIPIIQSGATLRLTPFSVDQGTLKIIGPEIRSEATLVIHPKVIGQDAQVEAGFGRVSGNFFLNLSNQTQDPGNIALPDTRILQGGKLAVSGLESYFAGETTNAPGVSVIRCTVEEGGHVDISGQLIEKGIVHWGLAGAEEGSTIDLTKDELPNFELRSASSDRGENTSTTS
jgi:hypothetical protein